MEAGVPAPLGFPSAAAIGFPVVARGTQTVWTFNSPHAAVDLPDAPIERTLGEEPRHYENTKWTSLPEAREESEKLEQTFGAVRREASQNHLKVALRKMKDKDRPHGMHFAGHGVFGDGGPRDGLMLGDGKYLKPAHVKSKRPFKGSPFVFLNACEIAAANSTLGVYGGMTRL